MKLQVIGIGIGVMTCRYLQYVIALSSNATCPYLHVYGMEVDLL